MATVVNNLAGLGEIVVGTGSATCSALSAGSEEILTITDTNVEAGDKIVGCFSSAANSTGTMAIINAYVSAASTIKVEIANLHASAALTAEAITFNLLIYSTSTNNR